MATRICSSASGGSRVGRDDLEGDRTAVGVKIDYPNDLWDICREYKRIGDAFDPSLGFVPRPGVQIANLAVNWQPRPQQSDRAAARSSVLLGE